MNKKELVSRTASIMRERGLRKLVKSPKQVFHISDDEGNVRDFTVRKSEKEVLYTVEDVDAVLNACIDAIKEALVDGSSVNIWGFGTFSLKYRKAGATRDFDTGEWIDIKARYVPKFSCGTDLRMCAKLYELSLNDTNIDTVSLEEEVDGG